MAEFLRPKTETLPESALIPEGNLVAPPTRVTHEVTRPEPYYYRGMTSEGPDGTFHAGTRVLLVREAGGRCRVVDEQGLSVEVACESLRRL
jgi:hypothetical protein